MPHFEWDPEKARTNLAKHGITFEAARHVWDDPRAIFSHEDTIDFEERWHGIGVVVQEPSERSSPAEQSMDGRGLQVGEMGRLDIGESSRITSGNCCVGNCFLQARSSLSCWRSESDPHDLSVPAGNADHGSESASDCVGLAGARAADDDGEPRRECGAGSRSLSIISLSTISLSNVRRVQRGF